MYALNKRFRLTEYWGMSTITIGAAIGGLILFITSIGMWLQANNLLLAILMCVGSLFAMHFAYKTHRNNQYHRIGLAIQVGKRDLNAKTLEVYFD